MAKNEVVLCDSNIFIYLFNGREDVKAALAKIGNENIAASIITYAEIIYGTKKVKLNTIKRFFGSIRVIDIDTSISKTFRGIVLNYSYNHHIKIPDAFIAATAINLNLTLYTENKKDLISFLKLNFINLSRYAFEHCLLYITAYVKKAFH